MSISWTSVETRAGRFHVASRDGNVVLVQLPGTPETRMWQELGQMFPGESPTASIDPVLARAATQIQEYIDGVRDQFTLPIELHGTKFQKDVWQALMDVPYGETRSYADIAAAVGKPSAARAVGGANRNNHLPLIVPCHRIIAADGGLGGYMGEWGEGGAVGFKQQLLHMERRGLQALAPLAR